MATLNIRNVPQGLHDAIKKISTEHYITIRGIVINALGVAVAEKYKIALPLPVDLDEDGDDRNAPGYDPTWEGYPDEDQEGEAAEDETVDPLIEKVAAQKLKRKDAVIKGDPKYVDAQGTYCGPLPGQDEAEWEIENEEEIMARILSHERLQVERETAQIKQNGSG